MYKILVLIGSIILGIYASDLHKILLNVLFALRGQPLQAIIYARLTDTIFASLCLIIFVITLIIKHNSIQRLFNFSVGTQILLICFFTLSLTQSYDNISVENYFRFLGGNILLFLLPIVICITEKEIKRVWDIWLFTTFILGITALWFAILGIDYTSGRTNLVQGTGITTAYNCAITSIYLLVYVYGISKRKEFIYYFFIIPFFLFAVITSGSKAAFLLLAFVILLYLFTHAIITKHVNLKIFKVIIIESIFVGIMLFMIYNLKIGGDIGEIVTGNSYEQAIADRKFSNLEYVNFSKQNLFTGLGIDAAYQFSQRTHSVFVALLVSIGILGAISYALFIFNILIIGFNTAKKRYIEDRHYSLCLVTFLVFIYSAVKGEVTSDISGNRLIWFFAGLLLALSQEKRLTNIDAVALKRQP